MDAILVTGFEPFQGEALNPSWEVARSLAGETVGVHYRVIARRLPTVYGRAGEELVSAIREVRPRAVVCLGEAGGRTHVTPERIAINIMDARIPDNAGQKPIDEPIAPDGPAAYFSTLPIRAMVKAMCGAGVPAYISNTAGTFVCNDTFYRLMHFIAAESPGIIGGFIHVPYMTEQVLHKQAPSLPLTTLVAGVRTALAVVASALGPAGVPKC
ncbi:pyroglutamyl-peptidase I [Alicyclobacillus acidocaldarius]|uniref:Pyrrolidone-carboxylate peptidase n=1 Tax=Alicyclobacillus acidocaldarius (strain Tc-4-1) TaxID=1048834 RepID=F8IIB9_ALIAT|nr:pyroglutamyl-peptidase I [Alicyclobacillus acidocaldarius]AEJ42078.1 pyrrolidone-carboxylate peptidase [Alicyclobacillus acidocaldarius subsp. acidocaldarius Tc-4-1]